MRQGSVLVSKVFSHPWVEPACLSGISLVAYLFSSLRTYRIGFPLDDAWIHQTYARNLARLGQWTYGSGQPSAGSTAPLWSFLLAVVDRAGLGPYWGTFLLGWLCLFLLALLAMQTMRSIYPDSRIAVFFTGAFFCLEWHLVWAAGSGMETLLFSLLLVGVLGWLLRGVKNWFGLGFWIGITVWIRPDGITFLGPAALVILFSKGSWRTRFRSMLTLFGGTLVPLIFYLTFNQITAGVWLPNTFFAKQAEYIERLRLPLTQRIWEQGFQLLVGPGILVLPGFFLAVWTAINRRIWGILAGAVWIVAFLLLYAMRLPVTYQHGRYIIPAMAIYFMIGLVGLFFPSAQADEPALTRGLKTTWQLSVFGLLVGFWILGARVYARDVAIIESEMVNTARWASENLPSSALIAAHDIGALGYFGNRELLDLAGLISPEVIPFIRNEKRIADFLDEKGADYLITFPGWYPDLTVRAVLMICSDGKFSPESGGENICIYKWKK